MPAPGRPPTRRERIREETTAEIKSIALQQLTALGAGSISLRGIAAEMGMTARAIYTYFPTRDDLITALTSEINTSLADALDRARDRAPADEGSGLISWGVALREWAIAHPAEFRLIYGDPVPGYAPPEDGPGSEAARRICVGLNRLVADEVWPKHPELTANARWSDFPSDYVSKIRTDAPEITAALAALALRVWARIHGLVTLEVYGHLRAVYNDPAAIQRADLISIVEYLGADSGSVRRRPIGSRE
jgi:AcrR family transcriptional regulator